MALQIRPSEIMRMEEQMFEDKEMRDSVLAELDRLPFQNSKYYVWDGFSCFFLKKDNGDYVLYLHGTLHSLGEDSPLNIRLAYNLLGLNERKAVETYKDSLQSDMKSMTAIISSVKNGEQPDYVHVSKLAELEARTVPKDLYDIQCMATVGSEKAVEEYREKLKSERNKNVVLVETMYNFAKAVKRTVPDYHGFVKEMVKVEQVLLANKAIRNNEGTISEADQEMRKSTLAELSEIEEIHKLYQKEIHLMRLKHQTEIDCMRERTINQEALSERRRKRMVDAESQHRDLLIQWSEERTKVVNALREVREIEARNALLVEGLKWIDKRIKSADWQTDACYPAYLIIEEHIRRVLAANKKEDQNG